jgi:hypothetical protein
MLQLQGGQVKVRQGGGGAKFAGTNGVAKVHSLALKVARKHPRARYGQVDGRNHRPRPTLTQDFFKPRQHSQGLKTRKRAADGLPSKHSPPNKTQKHLTSSTPSGEVTCGPSEEEVRFISFLKPIEPILKGTGIKVPRYPHMHHHHHYHYHHHHHHHHHPRHHHHHHHL